MIKKVLFGLVAILTLFATSCQNELDTVAAGEETSIVSFSIETPELSTRSYSDGTTATELQYAVFDLEARNFDVTPVTYLENLKPISKEKNGTSWSISFKLVTGNSYRIVFWAAAKKEEGVPAPYTFDPTTATVTVNYEDAAKCNDEARDAFYGRKDFSVDGNQTVNVKLKRPFAQLNIGTSDYADAAVANVVPTLSKVTVEGIANKLNLFTDAVEGNETVTFDYAAIPYTNDGNDENDENFPVEPEKYKYLAMNYLLVGAQKPTVVDIEFTCKDNIAAPREYTRKIGCVPLQGNYRTNIYGQILTSTADLDVEITPGYGGDSNVQTGVKIGDVLYNTLAEAYAAAQNGDELVVVGNIVLTEMFVVEKNITLNLNGNEITTSYNAETAKHLYAFNINNGAAMTIKNGTVKARGIYNYGTLTLESGAVIDACDGNGGYGVCNYGTFVMNGGEVKASYEDDNQVDKGGYDATPIRNENGGKVTINGGEVNNVCDFTFAIDNQKGGEVTVNGGKFTSIHSTVSTYGTMTINGGEFICNGLEGVTAHALVAWNGSTTTIIGGTFDGKDNYNGFNVDAEAGATVYIKGGEFKPVHSGSLYGDGSIIVSGGVFFDKIAEARLGEGCSLTQLADGKWKVEGKGWYVDANGNYHIEGAKGWLWMADQNDTFFGSKTIYLDNDIDFSGVDIRVTRMWTPEYSATFDGQNHTISNIWMASNYGSNNQALFDGLMSVKNLKVDRASVFGMSQVGIIGANIFGNIENCHVTNSRSYGYVHHVGGIVGLHSWGEIKNCSVENTSIECYYYGAVGAIAGAMNEVSRKITGCSVKGCRLIKEGPEGEYPDWDPLFGVVVGYGYAPGEYVFGCEITNTTIKGAVSTQMYGELAAGSTVNGVQP